VESQEKVQGALVVKVSDNQQIYGRGPEFCSYWGELAKNANDIISKYLFSLSEEVCTIAGKFEYPLFPKNWDRWVRACLQDFHEFFSRFFNISRYTYTMIDFFGGHDVCLLNPFFMDQLNHTPLL